MKKLIDVTVSIIGVILAVAVTYAILAGMFWIIWRI